MAEEDGSTSALSPSTVETVAKPKRDMQAELLAWKQEKAAKLAAQKAAKGVAPKPFTVSRASDSPRRAARLASSENVPCFAAEAAPSKAKTPMKAANGAVRSALSERCPNTETSVGAPFSSRSVSPLAQRYNPAPRPAQRTKTPERQRSAKTPERRRPAASTPQSAAAPVSSAQPPVRAVSPGRARPTSPSLRSPPVAAATARTMATPESVVAASTKASPESAVAAPAVATPESAGAASTAAVSEAPVDIPSAMPLETATIATLPEKAQQAQQAAEVVESTSSSSSSSSSSPSPTTSPDKEEPLPGTGAAASSASPPPPREELTPSPPAPAGPPPVMPLIEAEATADVSEPAAPSSPCLRQSCNLLAAYLPSSSPKEGRSAAPSPSAAVRSGGGLLAAYEERSQVPKMPPPSPATPSAALAAARAEMQEFEKARTLELAQAAGAVLERLAEDSCCSPLPTRDQDEAGKADPDADPLSPLSLGSESPASCKVDADLNEEA